VLSVAIPLIGMSRMGRLHKHSDRLLKRSESRFIPVADEDAQGKRGARVWRSPRQPSQSGQGSSKSS